MLIGDCSPLSIYAYFCCIFLIDRFFDLSNKKKGNQHDGKIKHNSGTAENK